ncbi:MAG: hypothetical protein LBG15_05295, partial [Dysgonamonadaceae bacterium]|nr:hypothetical protein [Dysgonamonadaceae bacterium]
MKQKMIFLTLTLFVLSAASANAQVRIGGDTDPNESAILDLNATNMTNNGTLGLALPRVQLTSTDDAVTIENPATGLVVYNTLATGSGATAVVEGLYIYDGSIWVLVDDVIGNEVTGATSGGGLEIAGSGITGDPYTLGIEDGGVTTAKIADKAVTVAKLDDMDATIGQVLMYDGLAWRPATLNPSAACSGAIVFDGAYDGPAEGTIVTGLSSGSFDPNWTNSA